LWCIGFCITEERIIWRYFEPFLKPWDVYGAGVSFHIGSGATDALSFADAIAAAREVFDVALRLKLPAMKILDIGGGFTSGSTGLKFLDASAAVNTALDAYFPPNMGVTIIAEPGRYFAETPATLATTVIGKRVRANIREYWINDGIYGSMNCLLYDHAKLKYRPLLVSMEEESGDLHTDWMAPIFHSSTVFGPTCDGLDTVLQGALLPELSIGDWILFPNMGAYTAAAGSSFNGFATSDIPTFYAFSVNLHGCPAAALSILKGLLPEVMKMLLSEVNFDTFGVEVNSEVSGSSSGSQLISVSNGGGYSWYPHALDLQRNFDVMWVHIPPLPIFWEKCKPSPDRLGVWVALSFFATVCRNWQDDLTHTYTYEAKEYWCPCVFCQQVGTELFFNS
jgi:hypothetical protein